MVCLQYIILWDHIKSPPGAPLPLPVFQRLALHEAKLSRNAPHADLLTPLSLPLHTSGAPCEAMVVLRWSPNSVSDISIRLQGL